MLYPIILFAFTFFYLFALALFYWMHSDIELLIKRDNIWEQHLFLHLIDKKKKVTDGADFKNEALTAEIIFKCCIE